MASLDDALDRLDTANGHLSAIDADLHTINASVQAVGTDVQATTQAVQIGFGELDSIVNYTNELLNYEISQNDTIICYLAKIAHQTCALLNEAALQTAFQQAMREDLSDLKELYALANPAAAVEQHRLEALEAKIEECCPPPEPEPPCVFEPCDTPGDRPPPPGGPIELQAPQRRQSSRPRRGA
jgi:hypothetical protein